MIAPWLLQVVFVKAMVVDVVTEPLQKKNEANIRPKYICREILTNQISKMPSTKQYLKRHFYQKAHPERNLCQ